MSDAIFISHASADRRTALAIAEGVEKRGLPCWIAGRDVKPGENYQEAIVAAIRNARALLLVFSEHANQSDEIKKELSLASRYRIPVITLRIADVEPSDAFAYELSTRQWIDGFPSRARALDAVAQRIGELDAGAATPAPVVAAPHRARRPLLIALALVLAILIGGAAWFATHRPAAPPKSMQVRLTGFKALSADIPAGMNDAMLGELTAALDEEGVVKVSSAPAAPPGTAPAFALGGTIRRDGANVRVIVRLVNERSGVGLWSETFNYGAAELSRVPRLVAVDAGLALRCGLFGISTYPRTMPDSSLNDYMTVCGGHDAATFDPVERLAAARKVVAAVPDFSWGWSGITVSALQAIWAGLDTEGKPLRREGLAAADRAIALDPTNSEALAWKNMLIDSADLTAREALLRRAVAARPLSCGCERNLWGQFLDEVGRRAEAVAEYRHALAASALDYYTQGNLGVALAATGREPEGRQHVETSIALADNPVWRAQIALRLAPMTRDYGAALAALDQPGLTLPPAKIAAWRLALQALASHGADRKPAIAALMGVSSAGDGSDPTVGLLGALGADEEALSVAERRALAGKNRARAAFFLPSLTHARTTSAFAGIAERVGLMRYWRAAKTRPDECRAPTAPPYCRAI